MITIDKVYQFLVGPEHLENSPEEQTTKNIQYPSELLDSLIVKDRLIYRWYPQNPLLGVALPVGSHAHYDIDSYEYKPAYCNFESKRINKNREYKGSYYHEICLNITPNELIKIKALSKKIDEAILIKSYCYNTCAGSTAAIIRASTGINIPSLIASSPSLSAGYLHFRKMLGDERIGDINYKGNYSRITKMGNLVSISVESILTIYAISVVANLALTGLCALVHFNSISNY